MSATETPLVPPSILATLLGPPSPPSDTAAPCALPEDPRPMLRPSERGPAHTLWTGRSWPFTCPTPADVHAADWHGLAFVNRYGGAAGAYSVMEHLVRGIEVARAIGLSRRLVLAYGLHDVPEVGAPSDLLGPLVAHLQRHEARTGHTDEALRLRALAEDATWEKCGVLDVFRDQDQCAIVHRLDVAMCAAEKRDLLPGWASAAAHPWSPREVIRPMDPRTVRLAYAKFLEEFAPPLAREFAEGWR